MDIQPSQPQNNINQPPAPLEPSPPAKKGGIKFGLSIAIVIICLVAAGVAVYWIKTEPVEQPESNIKISKPTDETAGLVSSPANGNGVNSVEGWQTYRNEEYGFEVKYPKDLYINDNTAPNSLVMNLSLNLSREKNSTAGPINIVIEKNKRTIKEFIDKSFPLTITSKDLKDAPIGNNAFKKYSYKGQAHEMPGQSDFTVYLIEHSGQLIQIAYYRIPTSSVSEQEFNQILSTFKFTPR